MGSGVPLVVAAALATLAVACGDANGPGGGTAALLTAGSYVDYDTASTGSESSQLEFTLKSFGVTVTQVNAIDSANLATILAGTGAFVIPEAGGDIALDLTAGAKTVLRRFVDSSGGVLIVTADNAGLALVDTLFAYSIVAGADSQYTHLDAAGAAGTPFAGGPSLLFENEGTYYLDVSTLPAAGDAIYVHSGGAFASVAYIPQGRGVVVLIGWDWYNAAPHGSQDGGWLEMLRRALRS
jgi:hypothetical protein